MRDILEPGAALVQEQLRRAVLVADEQIEESVVVDVHPHRRLRRSGRFSQAALGGDVGERPVAVVPQQRLALRHFPAAAQNQNVFAAVVVVVGLQDVQAAELVGEARRLRPFRESAVAVVAEIVERPAAVKIRRDDVEAAGTGEIVDDHAAGGREDVQTRLGRHIGEAADVLGGGERGRRDEIRLRHARWIFPQRHVREVQQPSHLELVGPPFEIAEEVSDRLFDVPGVRKRMTPVHRKETQLAGRAVRAVVHFRFVEIRESQHLLHLEPGRRHTGDRDLVSLLIRIDRAIHQALVGELLCQPEVGLHQIEGWSRRGLRRREARKEVLEHAFRGGQ